MGASDEQGPDTTAVQQPAEAGGRWRARSGRRAVRARLPRLIQAFGGIRRRGMTSSHAGARGLWVILSLGAGSELRGSLRSQEAWHEDDRGALLSRVTRQGRYRCPGGGAAGGARHARSETPWQAWRTPRHGRRSRRVQGEQVPIPTPEDSPCCRTSTPGQSGTFAVIVAMRRQRPNYRLKPAAGGGLAADE